MGQEKWGISTPAVIEGIKPAWEFNKREDDQTQD